jgi:malonate-semialdehyde dehydrogenase (acetylating) / methylmalonate-semialdehyde dehydrogenase
MKVPVLRNYIDGGWVEPTGAACLDVENPATGEILARCPLSGAAEVDQAVTAADRAFPAWSEASAARRVAPLFRLAALLRQHEDELARLVTREMGKSLGDARAELKRAYENVETACGMPVHQMGDKLVGCAEGIDGEVLRLPLGVFAMSCPFNFPAMVPFWFMPYALATGNTFVVKPSEQVPLTLQRIAQLLHECGLPRGVFNLVNGDKTVSEALLDHPRVAGFSVVGSSKTCAAVAERGARHNKRVLPMGGAKNHLVVMPDARFDEVVRNLITSCYGCAGQRCMAASAIVTVGEQTHREISARFLAESRRITVGDPLAASCQNDPQAIGPVISARALAFIHTMIDTGVREGATLALDGRGVQVPGGAGGHYLGPTVFTGVRPGMQVHLTEIFGPVVVMLQADTLDDAIRIINDHPYGNGASIYTQSGYHARKFKLATHCGMIGVNVGIPAPVATLPFGGMKQSLWAAHKAQGKAVIDFFTDAKIVTERYWPDPG